MVADNGTADPTNQTEVKFYGDFYRITGTATFGLLSVIGVVGNLLVITVVFKVKNMVTPTNCYLVSLAASDCLFFLAASPVQIAQLQQPIAGSYVFGPAACALLTYVPYMAINTSSLSITAFTIERYIGICHPLRARYMCTVKRARIIITCIWVFSIVYNSPWLYLAELKPVYIVGNLDAKQCTFKIQRNSLSYKVIFLIDFMAFYVIPMLMYIVIYTRIVMTLSSRPMLVPLASPTHSNVAQSVSHPFGNDVQRPSRIRRYSNYDWQQNKDYKSKEPLNKVRNINENGSASDFDIADRAFLSPSPVMQRSNLSNKEMTSVRNSESDCVHSRTNRASFASGCAKVSKGRGQVVKMLVVVVSVFAVCWFPYRSLVIYNSFASKVWVPIWYLWPAKAMIYINCAINPVLYNLMSERFRSSFSLLISSSCQRRHDSTTGSIVGININQPSTVGSPKQRVVIRRCTATPTTHRTHVEHRVTTEAYDV